MKKAEQIEINNKALEIFEQALMMHKFDNKIKLRSCNAYVIYSDHYWYLISYNTLVAVINRNTGLMVDMLRYVYGYTSTSAQHIAKFAHDYNAVKCYRYYSVQ